MQTYTLSEYTDFIMNQQNICMEVRSVLDPLLIEKIQFMKENLSSHHNLFAELMTFPYKLRDVLRANVINDLLKVERIYTYYCDQRQIIYVLWIDKNKNMIEPQNWSYAIIDEKDTFTLN